MRRNMLRCNRDTKGNIMHFTMHVFINIKVMQSCTFHNAPMHKQFSDSSETCFHSHTKAEMSLFPSWIWFSNIWFGLKQIVQTWAVFFRLLLIRTIMTSSLFPSFAFLFPTVSTLKTIKLLLFKSICNIFSHSNETKWRENEDFFEWNRIFHVKNIGLDLILGRINQVLVHFSLCL